MFKILFFICESIFYVQYVIIGIIIKIFFLKTKIYYEDESRQNKRIKGSVIVISNHRSFLDGLVITLKYFFNRWMFISEDFFKYRLKIIRFIVRIAGGIFVDSNFNSFEFIEESKKITAKGRPIMIFPEGDFKYTYEPSKFYSGYIMLAVNTGVKIVPVVNDFNYGIFKRVHIMIGNSIDLSEYSNKELTWVKRKEINKEIYDKFIMLFYKLKKRKAEKYLFNYEYIYPQKGDVIRIPAVSEGCSAADGKDGSNYHYGIYLNDNEVIQFGHALNKNGSNTAEKDVIVNSVSFKEFCDEKMAEVRIIKKRFKRKVFDIEKYAKSCLGQGRYCKENNSCLDFVNRVSLKI